MVLMKVRELVRLLEGDRWRLVAQRGSHQRLEHPREPGKVQGDQSTTGSACGAPK